MKVVSIVGARPQFIKAAPVSHVLRRQYTEVMVHTGQHYDEAMSDVFFRQLDLPSPEYHLGVGSGSHGWQTGQMLMRIEEVLIAEKPDWVLVYGDTNSTLAGALASAKLQLPLAHVEAGLRSFNRAMPEEINRIVADHLASLLLCPSQTAVANLAAEGITRGVQLIGDVMADALTLAAKRAQIHSEVLAHLGLSEKAFLLATVHRAENTDNLSRLQNILLAFEDLDETIVFPVHPRTRRALERSGYTASPSSKLRLVDPVGYFDMVRLEQAARMILTDSGGIQKEAYWLGVPCVTLRDETEWIETVQLGWNILAGADRERIVQAVRSFVPAAAHPPLYGDGQTAERIASALATEARN